MPAISGIPILGGKCALCKTAYITALHKVLIYMGFLEADKNVAMHKKLSAHGLQTP